MEDVYKRMSLNGIEYKGSDFKTEVHFFGQIVGATNLTQDGGLFCEAFFEAGDKWKCLSPNPTIQTQTSYANITDFVCFAHPFDLHYTTDNIYGWPKLIARIWKLDETNKIDLLSYGCINLPNTAGYHEIKFDTWILHGNLKQETLSFFLDTKPMMNSSDPVASDLENRRVLITKPGPTVILSVEVILKYFKFNSISAKNN